MRKCTRTEAFLWSIAFPGFGQLLNGKWVKGLLLIGLEFLVNVRSHLNELIISSFHADTEKAIADTNYEWLMFYPCIYMFGIWDAYKDAGGGTSPFAVIPFAFAAYFGTIGIIFSRNLLGAMWLGIAAMCVGIALGLLIRAILRSRVAAGRE
jgi:hypothetical protein